MRNGFNTKVTEPQNIEIPAVYLTSWLQRHAADVYNIPLFSCFCKKIVRKLCENFKRFKKLKKNGRHLLIFKAMYGKIYKCFRI